MVGLMPIQGVDHLLFKGARCRAGVLPLGGDGDIEQRQQGRQADALGEAGEQQAEDHQGGPPAVLAEQGQHQPHGGGAPRRPGGGAVAGMAVTALCAIGDGGEV
jgi:hypothetical protein